MGRITREEIGKAQQALANLNEKETQSIVRVFQKRQVALLVYSAAVSEREGFNDDEQDMFFTMTLLSWQVLKKHYPRMKKIKMKDIEDTDDQIFSSLRNSAEMSDEDQLKAGSALIENYREPELLGYLIEHVVEAPPESGVREEMKGVILMTLRIILDLMIQAIHR